MSKLNINGFEFPSHLQAQCAIANICQEAVEAGARGITQYDMKRVAEKYYDHKVIDSGKSVIGLVIYRWDTPHREFGGFGKLFNVSQGTGFFEIRYTANEYTIQVANMLPDLEKLRTERKSQGEEYRKKKLEKILQPDDFNAGDIVKLNKLVFDLQRGKLAKASWPDSWFKPLEILSNDGDTYYHNPGIRYDSKKTGVFLGYLDVKVGAPHKYAVHKAALVQWFESSAPILVDIRALKKV
jgi:hypothetical protein